MNWWTPLMLGLILGWGLELAIDYLYWRNRYPEGAREAQLELRLAEIEAENKRLRRREAHSGDSSSVDQSRAAHEARLDALVAEARRLEVELAHTQQALAECAARLQQISHFYEEDED